MSQSKVATQDRSSNKPREGFLDTIRTIATIRVIIWHAFGFAWISYFVASMPTMFFVAGSLLYQSLERRDAKSVIKARLKRLLIPLWAFSTFAISVMSVSRVLRGGEATELGLTKITAWIFPYVDPKGSVWESGWLSNPLWYLRAFIWLMIASPFLKSGLRRFGNFVFLVPILTVFLVEFLQRNPALAPESFKTAGFYVGDFALYSIFLMLGFRHRQGLFTSVSISTRIEWGCVFGFAAMLWAITQPVIGHVVNNSYPLHFFVGSAWLCVFLACEPILSKAKGTRIGGALIGFMAQRSLTVYLWHTTTIVIADAIRSAIAPNAPRAIIIPLVMVLVPVACALFGWVEDLTGGKAPQLWPGVNMNFKDKVPELASFKLTLKSFLATLASFGTAMAIIAAVPNSTITSLSASKANSNTSPKAPAPSARPDLAVFTNSADSSASTDGQAPVSEDTTAPAPKAKTAPAPSARPDLAVFDKSTDTKVAATTPKALALNDPAPNKQSATPAATQAPQAPAAPSTAPPTPAPAPAATGSGKWKDVDSAKATKLQAIVDAWAKGNKVDGVTIAIGMPDNTMWSTGSGTLKKDQVVQVTSVTKTFTSALTLSLIDKGKLGLEDPIPKIASLPTFPYASGITPKHLMSHTSGLSTYQDSPEYLANPGMDLTPAQAVGLAAKLPLLWKPGTASGYSSSGYLSLGLIDEQIGGDTYTNLISKTFIEPLGLKNTKVDETPIPGWIGFSTGGILSNMSDLVTWGAALYRDKTVLSAKSSAAMINIDNDWSVGLGAWPVCPCSLDAAGKKQYVSIGHDGGNGALEYSPADKLVIAGFLTEPIFNGKVSQQDLNELFAQLRVGVK